MRMLLCPARLSSKNLALKKLGLRLVCTLLTLASPLLPAAHAETFAVVDTARILSASAPAKAGETHLQNVQTALQLIFEDSQKKYKGNKNSLAAQRALREGKQLLDQQLAAEQQAVRQVVGAALEKAVKNWRVKNKKYLAVLSKQILLDSDSSVDVTPAIMREMDKQTVTFADLPTVQAQAPKQAGPKAGAPTTHN